MLEAAHLHDTIIIEIIGAARRLSRKMIVTQYRIVISRLMPFCRHMPFSRRPLPCMILPTLTMQYWCTYRLDFQAHDDAFYMT